jgi:hypothetical protein
MGPKVWIGSESSGMRERLLKTIVATTFIADD